MRCSGSVSERGGNSMGLLDRLRDSLPDEPPSPTTPTGPDPAKPDAHTPDPVKPAATTKGLRRLVSVTVGVPGANVTLRPDLFDPLTATANDNGRVTFEVPPAYSGGASLHVEANGFTALDVRVPVPIPESDAELDPVTLQRSGRGSARRGVVGLSGRSFQDE